MAIKTYDPKNISLIIGTHIVDGFEDGTFVSIERNNDTWTLKKGASGESARAKSNDRSGRFTFTLMQTSLSNDFLSALAISDEKNNNGLVPVLVLENGGLTAAEATEAWVIKPSNVEYSKEIGSRAWVLETGELILNVGGIVS